MKFKNLLLIAGLLLASGLQAMQPLAPGLISTDYSDDSGSESDSDVSPAASVISGTRSTPAAKQPIYRTSGGTDYDSTPWRGAGVRELSKEQPLEPAIEYTDRPRPYPALPKGLFTEVPSKQEPDTRFYKDIRRAFLTPIGTEPRLEKPVGVDPTLADKPYRLDNFAQRNRDIQPLQTILDPKESDKQPWYGTTLAPSPIEKPIESAIEYTERPRPYPALPKGLFITPPSTKEFDEPLARKKILADEPTLAKQPPVYADKPTVLPTRSTDIAPMGILNPQAPIIEPKKSVLPVIVASLLPKKHAQFEVTITNNTNEKYTATYNDERYPLEPNEQATINIEQLQTFTKEAGVMRSTVGGVAAKPQILTRTINNAVIGLYRNSDRQQYLITVAQSGNKQMGGLTIMIRKDIQGSAPFVTKMITHEFARKGSSLYFPITITLEGKDLGQTKVQAIPTEQ